MEFLTLDIVSRRWLLEKGYPIHYYLEALLHSSSAIRELSKDTFQVVNTVNLPVNEYGACNLPADFVDEVAVCFSFGSTLQQLPKKDNINPLRIHNETTGQFVRQPTQSQVDFDYALYFGSSNWMWYWNANDYGEPTGRYFGAKGGTEVGYEVIRSRRQIQFSDGIQGQSVILMYIGNGQAVDNATQIDWRAFRCIQSYIDWQRSPNAAFKDSPEARTYYNEKRLLRANMNDMDIVTIKNILRNNFRATMKN